MQLTESRGPGYFIAIDGGNGAGKSTVINALVESLTDQGFEIVLTREPGGTAIGEKIRELLLERSNDEMHPTTELLLFAAARAQHYQEKIRPALDAGKLVITDRFSAATVAFQGYAQGIDIDLITQANSIAVGQFKPDLNLILDLDPRIGFKRMQGRAELDRHEIKALEFHERARQGYLAQAQANPDSFAVIDASQPPELVLSDALQSVEFRMIRDGVEPSSRFLRSQESCY